jgi:hypothetical protein
MNEYKQTKQNKHQDNHKIAIDKQKTKNKNQYTYIET